jgi:hypothetical protein
MWLEQLGQLKSLITSSGIKPATILLVAELQPTKVLHVPTV